MKFAIMSRILNYEGYGIQTYLCGLLGGIEQVSSFHEIILLVDPLQYQIASSKYPDFTVVPISPKTSGFTGKLIWDHLAVGLTCKRLKVDAVLAPAHVRPYYAPCPTVVAVHDMMYHLFPRDWGWFDQTYFRIAVSMLTSRADLILAVSENTRKDVIRLLKYPEDRVKVVYHGVPDGFSSLENLVTLGLREKYKLYNSFILYIGSSHPRKNLLGLVDAFETVASDFPHELVILGSPIWFNSALEKRLQESKWVGRIHRIGYVPRGELPLFYNEAEVFVFPSLYEGFGLPVLEAMACGCAVVTTNTSSIPEVAGDAALLVKPGDEVGLAHAIRLVLTDSELRSSLRQRALEQAKKFTWARTAEQTIALLEEAASARHASP